jgi:hypothetical protein
VIMAASTGNIAGTGQTALIVGNRVIKIGPRRGPTADREPAVLVTHFDQVSHPVRDPVSGRRVRMTALAAGTAIRVIGVRVIAVRAANLAGRRYGSRQDGPQSGSQLRRRVQATLSGGRWLTQEHDRHRNGDPPEHACSKYSGPGHALFGYTQAGPAGSGRVRIRGGLVCI